MYIIHEYPYYIQYEVVRKGGAAEFALGRSDSVEKRHQMCLTPCGTCGDWLSNSSLLVESLSPKAAGTNHLGVKWSQGDWLMLIGMNLWANSKNLRQILPSRNLELGYWKT